MRLRPVLTCVSALAIATPIAITAAVAAPTSPSFPREAGVAGPLAEGVGTNLKPVAAIAYKGGTDLEFVTIKGRDYAVAPSEVVTGGKGMLRMIDITNPVKPKLVGALPCHVSQNDVQVHGTTVFMGVDYDEKNDKCFEDARAKPATGVIAVDISNPARPRGVGFVPIPLGAHNTTLHPSGKFLYVSDSELVPANSSDPTGRLGRINVIDVSNLKQMKEIYTLPLPTGLSSHDITFNKAGTRAYSAAITQTLILDTTNAAKPTIKTTIVDPAVNISHGADPAPDEKHLYVTDEQAGAAGNGVCNVGGVHIYDITNELAPVKTGYYTFNPTNSATATTNSRNLTCTAHVLDFGPTGKTFSNAGYAAGVRIVDITSRIGYPTELAAFTALDADTWSAKQYKNPRYLFSNDLARGFDVFEYIAGKGLVDTRSAKNKQYGIYRKGGTMFSKGAWCANPKGTAAINAAARAEGHHA
ncbi:MAG TPA: hypothetical protein VNA30_00160 [Mycobacteriales bacterium]|nr:hypothetical protein [Mycobacteriales bacterium]